MQTAKRPKPYLTWLRYHYLVQYYLLSEEKQEELIKLLNEPELDDLNLPGILEWEERMKDVFGIKTEEDMNVFLATRKVCGDDARAFIDRQKN